MAGRAGDRAGPLAVDVDQPDAGGLQPAQDPLGLLGGRGRDRAGGARRTVSARGAQLGDVLLGVGARRGSRRRRRAGRGGRRGRPSGRRPRGGRRPARAAGSGRESRWVRAAARTNAASRSRWTPASSNRSSVASVSIRRLIASTTSSGRRSRLSRSWRTTAAYVAGSTLPSHGERQRPISASTQGARDGARADAVGALPDREGVVQRGQALLGRAPRPERAEVVGAVVEHPLDQRQPRPRLGGQLDEVRPSRGTASAGCSAACARRSGAARAPRPRAASRTRCPVDLGGQPDHLAHPGAGLRGGEVGAHPGCAGRARCRRRAPGGCRRGTGRRPGRGGGARRGGACGAGPG